MSKNLPPPPAPIELTPLEEAQKLIGQPLTPALVEAVRLVANAEIDKLAMRDYCDADGKSYGIPFEVVRRGIIAYTGACACAAIMLNKDRVS